MPRREPALLEEPIEPAAAEVMVVLELGPIGVHPVFRERRPDERIRVGHRQKKEPVVAQDLASVLERGLREGHVLEHVGHRNHVEAAAGW